ncbi:MAG TPA: hypothetical protein VFN91_13645, partial [Myxococcaceae bacterium]|nr:hypothetical protein [Myxococcaceae bacterium]
MSSLLFAAAVMLLHAGGEGDRAAGRSVSLTVGRPVPLELPCVAGELVRGSIAPDVQPVIALLRDPSGELLAEVRNPIQLDEPLPVAGIPARSGTCTRALSLESGPPGEIQLRMDVPRPATSLDLTQIEGERTHQRALLLWSDGSAASMKEAVKLETRAAELAHEAGDLRGEANAHASGGGVLWQLGEFEAADRELTTAIELRTRLGDPRALAEAYNDRSVVLTLTHLSAALDDLTRARALAEPL